MDHKSQKIGHILVVEDNQIHQELLYLRLRKLGHKVSLAENGIRALALLGQDRFGLVFMDCALPELDGLETTRRLRAGNGVLDPQVPVIAVTASAMEGDRTACLEAGMDDYLSKPFSALSLEAVIERYLIAAPDLAEKPGFSRENEAQGKRDYEAQWQSKFQSLLKSVSKN